MRLGPTEGEGAELDDRQAVDLADLDTLGVDQDDAAVDRLLRPIAQPVGALDLLVDGAGHVLPRGDLALGLLCPIVGLAHDVGDAAELDRQLLAVVGQPGALVDDAGDTRGVHRLQAMLLHHRRDQPRVGVVVLRGALDGVVEIRLHLEEAREVGIVGRQQIVELAIAEQHHLDLERDRLGIEGLGRDEAGRLDGLLDADLARLDGSLERFPGKGRQQQAAGIEQEIAPVGFVQGTRLDQQEVGHQRAHLGEVLDASDHVAVGGIVLLHDGGAAASRFAVGGHDVDLVSAQAGILGAVDRPLDDGVLLFARGQEEGDIAHHVVAGGLEVGGSIRHVAERSVQLDERVPDGRLCHLLVELAELRAAFLVRQGQPLENGAQLLFQDRDLVLDIASHGFRQRIEDLGLHHLALMHGRHGKAGGGAQQRDVLGLRFLAQRLQRLLVAGAELLVDGAPAHLVVLALEADRQHATQLVERRDHALGEVLRPSMRKLERLGAIGRSRNCAHRPSRRGCSLCRFGAQVRLAPPWSCPRPAAPARTCCSRGS